MSEESWVQNIHPDVQGAVLTEMEIGEALFRLKASDQLIGPTPQVFMALLRTLAIRGDGASRVILNTLRTL